LLAEKIGLHCSRGIVVNDTLQTITDPRIYSVGECGAHRGIGGQQTLVARRNDAVVDEDTPDAHLPGIGVDDGTVGD
jgi:NAD(P)H-nitrite reductase large subunit